jgi:hypothetical protein
MSDSTQEPIDSNEPERRREKTWPTIKKQLAQISTVQKAVDRLEAKLDAMGQKKDAPSAPTPSIQASSFPPNQDPASSTTDQQQTHGAKQTSATESASEPKKPESKFRRSRL